MKIVAGTPQWAVAAAYGAVLSVVPSALWRTAVGIGVPLGWSQEQLRLQQIPGSGTVYVIALSVVSVGAALLTLGLICRWGEVLPRVLPFVGVHRTPRVLVTLTAVVGAFAVMVICVLSVVNWDSVSGFADRPDSVWAMLMLACYLPALLWGPLLLAVTWAYWQRGQAAEHQHAPRENERGPHTSQN